MNIKDAKQEIIHTILAYTAKNDWGGYAIPAIRQRPLLLIGPPGIGKTAVMSQAAAQCGVGFLAYTMTHHTRQSALGLPYIEHRSFGGREHPVTEYTMSEIIASVYRTIEETGCREGLLFLDEINCVSETLAPAMLQFLQTKTFGSHRLPEGWVLAGAGNPQEYNKSVREFDIATLDRLKYIPVEADYDAWRSYALESGIHAAILSYLDVHPDKFYVLEQTYSRQAFATARGWEDLSCLLMQYEALCFPVTLELIMQYLHTEELARDFHGYYHWFLARKRDLPVRAMLEGSREAAQVCRGLLLSAPFSEALHMVHLMLSCIGTKLQDYLQREEQQKDLAAIFEQLQRFQKQQGLPRLIDAVVPFLEKERKILEIRRDHGLSSEEEVRRQQRTLYDLQELSYRYQGEICPVSSSVSVTGPSGPPQTLDAFCAGIWEEQEAALNQLAGLILKMLKNGLAQFAVSGNPDGSAAFFLFLSSLRENGKMAAFLRRHPCADFEKYCERLDFQNREAALRTSLLVHN